MVVARVKHRSLDEGKKSSGVESLGEVEAVFIGSRFFAGSGDADRELAEGEAFESCGDGADEDLGASVDAGRMKACRLQMFFPVSQVGGTEEADFVHV